MDSKRPSEVEGLADTQGLGFTGTGSRARDKAQGEESQSFSSKYVLALNQNNSQLGVHEQQSADKKARESLDSEYGL